MNLSPAFSPLPALAGGMLIGVAASVLLLVNGRTAGISGIVGGLSGTGRADAGWRFAFLAGLAAVAVAAAFAAPGSFDAPRAIPAAVLIASGLLVGYGTQLGNGCTSGHGVCGLSRFAGRSLAATLTFMATAAAAVFVVRHVAGGNW